MYVQIFLNNQKIPVMQHMRIVLKLKNVIECGKVFSMPICREPLIRISRKLVGN